MFQLIMGYGNFKNASIAFTVFLHNLGQFADFQILQRVLKFLFSLNRICTGYRRQGILLKTI